MTDEDSSAPEASRNLNAEAAGNGAGTTRIGQLLYEDVTRTIIAAFYTVYNKLGYGFLENVYCAALALELRRRGHKAAREVTVPVFYDGEQIAKYRADFVVDDVVLLEVKSTAQLSPNNHRQLLNCLRATPLEVGLLLHFGPEPKFHRIMSSRKPSA
jgi:GxxExxY protein